MLNDPMEANALQVYLDCMGAGYTLACGKIHPIVEDRQNQYRVLSVSAIPNSPIMWAHYASGYSGCCLIYSTEKTFSEIKPVIYTDITFDLFDIDFMDDEMSEAIEESLCFKHKDWAYENEWRLIQNEDAGFLNYEASELVGIIIGENMSLDKRKVLVKLCKDKNVPCFRTYTMKAGMKLVLPRMILLNHWVEKSTNILHREKWNGIFKKGWKMEDVPIMKE